MNNESAQLPGKADVAVSLRVVMMIAIGLCACLPVRAQIPEPETIFYGKIINRSSGQENLVTQGNLRWVISRPDGTQLTLETTVAARNANEFSYELAVPQEAVNFGLSVSPNSMPLPVTTANCSHLSVSLDGTPARIMVPGSSAFAVAQNFRGATYRLDLEIGTPMISTSGDGIPDWWKARYGVIDPNADPDGDGWSNLREFQMGSDPRFDNRIPQLATRELFVYADGSTGVRLRAIDADSPASNLVYTVTQLPTVGALYLSNARPGTNRTAVAVGDSFTQDDLARGRLVYLHSGDFSVLTGLRLVLRDEDITHPACTNVVRLNLYRPSYPETILQMAQTAAATPAGAACLPGLYPDEQQVLMNYYLSRDHGYVIWDACRAAGSQQIAVPSADITAEQYAVLTSVYGRDQQHVLTGGPGNDFLAGGMENDILITGNGGDSMRGNGGADLFVIQAGSSTIEDFKLAEKDGIDISRMLNGTSSNLNDYVQVTSSESNTTFAISMAGNQLYTNATVVVAGVQWTQADLAGLVDNGSLYTGNKLLPPVISIVSASDASQNGPTPGVFRLARSGSTAAAINVQLAITGSAVNGRDFESIPSQVTFPAGKRVTDLLVRPYVNTVTVTQAVQLAVLPGVGYSLGSPSAAQLQIEPLAPQITIEALQPIASKVDQSDGVFLISRGGVLDRSVLVRLNIGGTAPASHYSTVPSFINLLPQQTTALITITPKQGIALSNGLEIVQISIRPDPAYRVMQPSTARVILVEQMMNLALWRQRFFPGSSQDGLGFAYDDPGNTGIRNIFRYAFGLDAQNPGSSRGQPECRLRNGRMVLSFRKPFAVTDLDYSVEVTDDLRHWRPATEDDLKSVAPADSNDLETVTYETSNPVGGASNLFMRVRVVPQ